VYSLTKAQVDALITTVPGDRTLLWGPAVTTSLSAVPSGNFITRFVSPTDPVLSRPLQIWDMITGVYTNVKVNL